MRKSSDSVTARQKGRFELQNPGNSPENGSGAGWEASANFCFWPLQCYRFLSLQGGALLTAHFGRATFSVMI